MTRAQWFLQHFTGHSLTGIITVNYDLLVEYALTTKNFNYGVPGEALSGRGKNYLFPWQGTPVILSGKLPLAKLHGSLSWSDAVHYTDGRSGLKGKAQIVPPHPDKAPSVVLKGVWELAEKLLGETTQLTIFGFAFNEYDRTLLDFLSIAGKGIGHIHLIDVAPPTDRARAVWPTAKITYTLPPWPSIPATMDLHGLF